MKIDDAMKRTTMIVMMLLLLFVLPIILLSICRQQTVFFIRSDPVAGTTLLKLQQTSPLEESQSVPRIRPSLASPVTCDRSNAIYDICSIKCPTVLDPSMSTFYVVGRENSKPIIKKIRPYPRKWESRMDSIKEVTLTLGPPSPPCKLQHDVPALVFSAGGLSGNYFHDFNEGFIPLFITVSSVFQDQDFVLVISELRNWWAKKYADLFRSFSKHQIIDLDNDTVTHCFPSATVGLMSHGYMTINPKLIPNSKNILHFHALLEKTYGSFSIRPKSRPQLVIAGRSGGIGRAILNQREVEKAAQEEGFSVVVFEPKSGTPLREAYKIIHSSHVMIGVHGGQLTNLLFLRPRSVFVQVIPIGLESAAEQCYGKPAKDIGVEYMEYKIGVEESSLVEKYGKDDKVFKDVNVWQNRPWTQEFMAIYLRGQNVKLDLVRFRKYLKRAYEKAIVFMNNQS